MEKVTEYTPEIRAYIRETGMKPVERLDKAIEQSFGYKEGGRIIDEMNHLFDLDEAARFQGGLNSGRQSDITSYINSTPKLSLLCSSFYDWYVFRRVMERICKYGDCFGKQILDVGCGNGLITIFIGRRFPESFVDGVDISPNAISTASFFAKSLNTSNSHFFTVDSEGLSGYDTVVSIRVIHENASSRLYAKHIASCVKKNGHLFAFERIPPYSNGDEVVGLYTMAGFTLLEESRERIVCPTGDETGVYLFAVFEYVS